MSGRLVIHTKTTIRYRQQFPGHVGEKWKVSGQVTISKDLKTAHIKVESMPESKEIGFLAVRHEEGHVEYAEDVLAMNPAADPNEACGLQDIFRTETDAWIRAVDGRKAFTYREGTFILDCLYSYGHHYATPEEWQEAVDQLAIQCQDPPALREYEPIKPPPGSPPPPGVIVGPAIGDGSGEGGPNGSLGEGGEPTGGEVPDHDGPSKGDIESLERTKVLTSPEGIAAARRGREALSHLLQTRGHSPNLDNLPPVVAAILPTGEEVPDYDAP